MLPRNMPHEREVPVMHVTDVPEIHKIHHVINRKHDINVFVRICVVIVVVGYCKIIGRDIRRYFTKSRITCRILHVKRRLRPEMNSCCRYQGQTALGCR